MKHLNIRIISLLGKGSFSYVFEAEEILTELPVAIKKVIVC